MKCSIIPDGPDRMVRHPEHKLRVNELRQSIETKYADEMASVRGFQKLLLKWKMKAEFRRELRKIEPSARAL